MMSRWGRGSNPSLSRIRDYDLALENSAKVLGGLQSLPASMKPPVDPIYNLLERNRP